MSRFVYTKLLSILGKAWMPTEALRIFTIMRVVLFFPIIIINLFVCFPLSKNRKSN